MGLNDLGEAWESAWAAPDRRSIAAWASENVNLQGDYAQTGFFRVETSRYLEKAFEFVQNDHTRQINLLKAIQTGGSLVGDVSLQRWFAVDPGPAQLVFQTDDDAEQHFLSRLKPTFKASPCNRRLFNQQSKKRDYYQFPHMSLYVNGANWNSLQRKSVRYQINDECWQWKDGMLEEAWGRTEAFTDVCKILNISQASEEDDEWHLTCQSAKFFDWCVRLPGAGLVPLEFFLKMRDDPKTRAGIVWSADAKNPDGSWNPDRVAETTRFRCPVTGKEYEDTPRNWARFNAWGEYACREPERDEREVTLRWNGLVNGHWGLMAKRYIHALAASHKGVIDPLKKFYQKRLVQFWADELEYSRIELKEGGYFMGDPWEESVFTALTADYQEGRKNEGEHFWVCVRGWAADGRSRLLYFGKAVSDAEIREIQEKFKIEDTHVAIDGGNELLYVASLCVKYGWIILEGAGDRRESFAHKKRINLRRFKTLHKAYSPRRRVDPLRGKRGAKTAFAWSFMWSNPTVKNITFRLRHGLGPDWGLPSNLPQVYRDGIDSEVKKRVPVKRTGDSQFIWYRLKENNHPWDCECMQVVMAMIRGIIVYDPGGEPEKEQTEKPVRKPERKRPAAPHERPGQRELLLH